MSFEPRVLAANTLIVTNTNDSGAGSLRQAIVDANATAGQDMISFNIPGGGVQTIIPNSAFPAITDLVVIDGYSQPGASPNTLTDGDNAVLLIELNGSNIGGFNLTPGLQLNASSCEVRGLVINRFVGNGISITGSSGNATSGNIIQGNFIGTDPSGAVAQGNDDGVEIQFSTNNLIGGTTPSARNVISGNRSRGIFVATGASTNVIQGNFIGTNANGTAALSNNSGGIFSGGSGPDTIGGIGAGARNVISGNLNNAGIFVQSGTSTGPTIQGNLIGTDVTGTLALGNSFGIWLNFGPSLGNSTIGGTIAGSGNVISGNRSDGVFISGSSRNNQLQGNLIGTDITGTKPLGNSGNGVQIDAFAVSNKIGGTSTGQGNTIVFNARNGVLVIGSPNATGNSIRRNSIFSNGALGIDLGGDGVTPNDPGDGDIGPNNLQNFPVITSVTRDSTQTTITGTLNSTPSTTVSVNLYSSSACDPSGNGEGTTPFGLGSVPVTTDANGNGSFGVAISVVLPAGQVITATTTDSAGNTSEFSPCDSTQATGAVRFAVASTRVIEDVGFIAVSVIRTGGSVGTLSVDYSTADITATAGQDYTSTSGTLVFNDGETAKTFDVPILDDAVTEPNESFAIFFSNASNLDSLGYPYSEIVTLQDHNTPPTVSINNVSVNEGNIGTTNANFTVTLFPITGRTVTVDYSTQALNATSGTDFQPVSGTLTLVPRVTSGSIAVSVIGDTIDEFNETFNVVLSNPSGATISGNPGMGTIIDDDPPPSVSISDTSIIEGNSGVTFAQFNLSLSGPSAKSICVQASTADGTATAASGDYHQVGGSITNPPAFISFNPGQTSAAFAVQVMGDTLFEPDETFLANITPCNGDITVARGQAVGTITNDDPPSQPSISITDVAVTDSNGSTNAVFAVTLSQAASQTVSVKYASIGGTATSGVDFQPVSGILTFSPGTTSQNISVPIVGDSLSEPNETFTIDLSEPVNATIADAQGLGTISDGPPSQLPTLSINDITVVEGDDGTSTVDFTVTLSHSIDQQVTFYYTTAPGTATEATPGHPFTGTEDYSWVSGTDLVFGATSRRISVSIYGDHRDEFDETFFVNISNPTNATIADSQGMATILDNDPPPTVSIGDVSAAEGDSSSTIFQFPVTLSAASGKLISLSFATSDQTAISGSDFVATSGTVTFNPGEVSKAIPITVNGDRINELNETFFLTLTNPQNVSITRGQATGTIINDDIPRIEFSTASYSVNEGSSFVTIVTNRAGDLSFPASVKYATSDTAGLVNCGIVTNQASERCDYVSTVGTLAFDTGESSKSFVIPIVDDVHVEGSESFAVTLSNPTTVPLGSPSTATVTIVDNDSSQATQNPIDGVDFFVRQQYLDILGRQPDQTGFQNWVSTLGNCPNGGFGEPPTSDCDRLHVAAGFFQSDEFLNRGYWAFRFYMVSFNQRPTYAQFIPDMSQVGGPKSPAEEESSKVAFADAFVQRPEFLSKYGVLSGQALADALTQSAGLPPFTLTAGMTNGQILRAIAERQSSLDKFLTEGTVSILYFGFQRRDPDTIGYQNNVNTLNADPNNLRHMIFIFIYSTEYRGRFGTP